MLMLVPTIDDHVASKQGRPARAVISDSIMTRAVRRLRQPFTHVWCPNRGTVLSNTGSTASSRWLLTPYTYIYRCPYRHQHPLVQPLLGPHLGRAPGTAWAARTGPSEDKNSVVSGIVHGAVVRDLQGVYMSPSHHSSRLPLACKSRLPCTMTRTQRRLGDSSRT